MFSNVYNGPRQYTKDAIGDGNGDGDDAGVHTLAIGLAKVPFKQLFSGQLLATQNIFIV